METWRYMGASLACGLIAVWASENMFWSAPPADLTATGWLLTWIAYALASAVALSAVAWAGCGGWRGVFLGGAILGFMVEGVLVDTMYDAFPFQLVWTPLAWHALATGLAVGGIGRMGAVWGPRRMVLAWAGVGLAAGVFALYWPLERGAMPGGWAVLGYLAGLGLAVPAGHVVLDRLGRLPRPHGAVLAVAPLLAMALWVGKTVAWPSPARLALPVMLGLTVWAMLRLGARDRVGFGAPAPVARHLLFLVAPLVACAVAVPGWALTGGLGTNIVAAVAMVPCGLGLWLWLLWGAVRRPARGWPRQDPAPPHRAPGR